MKKTKKALASLAIAGMFLTMVPFNAFAAGTVPNRLAGTTAAETAVKIADQTGWTGTAILASSASYGMVDALTSGPLASFLKAPILLQEPGAVLNANTKDELIKLAVKKVYVTSGTAVINQAVLDQLSGMGITVVSLGGADRFETSVNIAKEMVKQGASVSKVAVAYGWLNQDALSIAAIASAATQPILLTEKNALPASVKAFLTANITSSDVIGGTGVISDTVKAALPNATRHAGNTAYDTNSQVIQDFAAALTFDNVYAANGVTGIDALAGAPLAAQTKSPIVLTDGKTVPAVAVFTHSKASDATVVTALGGEAVVPETIRAGIAAGTVKQDGNLSVTSVSAISASDFKVVFSQAPVDTSKVVFTVSNGTQPVTVSATWNAAKTEATLTSSAKYVAGSYTVKVVSDNSDLGTSTVAVTEQKVAKIEITSTKLGVVNKTDGTQVGYATYRILDQYKVDITDTALANNVNFQSGVSNNMTWKNGLLTMIPTTGLNLLTFGSGIVITANDTSTGVSTTATLAATSQIGTLSDITLTTLTNADGKVLTAGDTTALFYAGFTATDISGNPTNNFTLMQQGLILQTNDMLTTSSPYVTAQLVHDPSDSTKGLIEVKADSTSITVDMPVVITAMTWTGKTSQINTTLKKQASVDSFSLYAPAESIASDESKAIPYSAVDQNGAAITKYSDLIKTDGTGVTFTNLIPTEDVDGTLILKNVAVTNASQNSVPQVLSAMTSTGHYSSITINIQKPSLADTLSLDNTVLTSVMQQATTDTATDGAVQNADFGWDNGGLVVKDQYGRAIDMSTVDSTGVGYGYTVVPSTSNNAVIKVTGTAEVGQKEISIQAYAAGTATVTFDLMRGTTKIDSKSQTFTVLKDADIKGYTATQYANPLYAINGAYAAIDGGGLSTVTGQEAEYKANPTVYGTTSSGAKVVLKGTPILSAVSTSADFTVFAGGQAATGPYAPDAVKIAANKPADLTKTDTSGAVIVSIMGADDKVHSVPIALKGSTAKAAASAIDVYVETSLPGVSQDGDTITLADASLLGSTLAKYSYTGAAGTTQNVYFNPTDQYGKHGAFLAQVYVTSSAAERNGHAFSVAQNGDITANSLAAGDSVTVSAVTTTTLVKTIKIKIAGSGVVVPPVTTAWTTVPTYAGFGQITGKVDPAVVKSLTAFDGAVALPTPVLNADGTFTVDTTGHQITTVTVNALDASNAVVLTQDVVVGL